MAFGINNKTIKVAWLSTFDYTYLKNGMPGLIKNSTPFVLAPWIGLSLDEFKKRNDVEIHLIVHQPKLIGDVAFEEEGIFYHLIANRIPLTKKAYPVFLKRLTKYYFLKRKVNKLLGEIKPDIVHMHGSDIDLVMCVLNIGYPVLLTPSTFMTHLAEFENNNYNRYRSKREKKAISLINNYGIRANFMKDVILKENSNAVFHWHKYPFVKTNIASDEFDQQTDIVFASRLNKNKGLKDLIFAMALAKTEYQRNLSLKIVGHGSYEEKKAILDLIIQLGLKDQVVIIGSTETQEELFSHMAAAKIYVLPTYFDMIPGTILESMHIGIPVIAYAVGGIPDLNIGEDRIVLVEKGNINQLTKAIIQLLDNPALRMKLIRSSKNCIQEDYDNVKAIDDMINAYKTILAQ